MTGAVAGTNPCAARSAAPIAGMMMKTAGETIIRGENPARIIPTPTVYYSETAYKDLVYQLSRLIINKVHFGEKQRHALDDRRQS